MRDFDLDSAIRKVPDFPKPGILFYDITSIFMNTEAFNWVIEKSLDIYKDKKIDKLLAVESRGFIFASVLAEKLGIPFALARKAGKLPGETISESYALEYGEATLEVHKADIGSGENILIIDDLIATGGTLEACARLMERLGAKVAGFYGVIGLPFLNYSEKLKGYEVTTLINYDSE